MRKLKQRYWKVLLLSASSVKKKNTWYSHLTKVPFTIRIKKNLTLHTEKDASEEIAWRNGTLLFKSIPLQEIVRQLSNAFHTDIRIEDADLQNYHMTATFSDGETLEEILSLLCRNQKFGYTKTNDTITITQKLN